MHTEQIIYHQGHQELHGYVAYPKDTKKTKPAVLVAHDWTGRNEFACQKAEMLANIGYIGFAIDMFGHGKLGATVLEKKALIEPLLEDRKLLCSRIHAAFDALHRIDRVDPKQLAAIGFCFGGLCVLDLLRSGADVCGVVSFHGLLGAPSFASHSDIKAKALILHGFDDPMVSPQEVINFCQEMTASKVDWQVDMYGHTQHAFTNPQAHDTSLGTIYDAKAEKRSLQAMTYFLQEIFAKEQHG